MKEKRVAFQALMKELNVKSLVSGDKAARVTFEIDQPPDALISDLNGMMKADALVKVRVGE
jgi:hypothetical protein